AAAKAAGLAFVYMPVVSGRLTEQDVEDFAKFLDEAEAPVLAYCRTGTRCCNLWALAKSSDTPASEIVGQALAAGYDLRGMAPMLESRRKS
ncbi:MAG: TIGR01244 family sulfur transferase, partial [Beijerinckiaceae bacterium]